MIEAQLNGRIKNKKRITKFVDDVFYHYFKNRMKRTVLVDIQFQTELEEGKIAGYCMGDKHEIQIDIARTENGVPYTTREICLNLAHELVHAKQFIRGEINPYNTEMRQQEFVFTCYMDKPYELEAYTMEEMLVEKYYDNC